MFTKFVNKKIQETLNIKEKTLSRQTVGIGDPDSTAYYNPFDDNPSAASYKSIKNIASRSLFFRFISNKKNPVVISGGERDENGKLKFGFGENGIYFDSKSVIQRERVENVDGQEQIITDYKWDGSGIRAIAGVKSVDIGYKGGFKAIREATVSWVAFSLEDLERLTPHFLTIGKTVLIDWGWVNKDSRSLQEEYRQGLFFDEDELKVDKSIFTNPQKRILDIGGNYGAMGGVISNFNYELRADGGFDCTTKIVAMGSPLFKKPIDKGISSRALLSTKFESENLYQGDSSKKVLAEEQGISENQKIPGLTITESQMDSLMLAILNLREIITQEMFQINPDEKPESEVYKQFGDNGTANSVFRAKENEGEGVVAEHRNGHILWAIYSHKMKLLADTPASEDIWISWAWFEDHILNRYISYVGEDDEVKLTLRSVDTLLDENGVPKLWSENIGPNFEQNMTVDVNNLTETMKAPTKISNHPHLHPIDCSKFILPGQSAMKWFHSDHLKGPEEGKSPGSMSNMRTSDDLAIWKAITQWSPQGKGFRNPDPVREAELSTDYRYFPVGVVRNGYELEEEYIKGPEQKENPSYRTAGYLRNIMVNIKEIQKAFGINTDQLRTPANMLDGASSWLKKISPLSETRPVDYSNSNFTVHVNDIQTPSTVEAGIKNLLNQLNENFFDIWDFELTSDPYDTTNIKIVDNNLSDMENIYTQFDSDGRIARKGDIKRELYGIYKFPTFKMGSMVKNQNLSFKIPNAMALTAMYGSNRNLKSITRDEQHTNSDLMTLFGNDVSSPYLDEYLHGLESTHRALGWGQGWHREDIVKEGDIIGDQWSIRPMNIPIGSQSTSHNSKIIKHALEDGVRITPANIKYFKYIDETESLPGEGHSWQDKLWSLTSDENFVYEWHDGHLYRVNVESKDREKAYLAYRGYYVYDMTSRTYIMDKRALPVIRNVIKGEINNTNEREEIYNHHLLIPADFSLEIDGIEGILPGDIIHTDYIQHKYNNSIKLAGRELGPSTFFQVFGVNHKIDASGWTTELTTKMRMNKDVLNENAAKIIDQLEAIPSATGIRPVTENNLDVLSNSEWMDIHGRPSGSLPKSDTEDIITLESLKAELERIKGLVVSTGHGDRDWITGNSEYQLLTQEQKDRAIARVEKEIEEYRILHSGLYGFRDMDEYYDEVMYTEEFTTPPHNPFNVTYDWWDIALTDYEYYEALAKADLWYMGTKPSERGPEMYDPATGQMKQGPASFTQMVSDTPGEATEFDPQGIASTLKGINMAFADFPSEEEWTAMTDNLEQNENMIGFESYGTYTDTTYKDSYVDIYGTDIMDLDAMEEFEKAVGHGNVSTIPETYLVYLQKLALKRGHPPLFMTVPPSLTGDSILKGGIELTEYAMLGKVGQVHGTQAIYDTKIMEELDRLVAEGKGFWRVDKNGRKTFLNREEYWATDGKPIVDAFNFTRIPNTWKIELSEENREIMGYTDLKGRSALVKDIFRHPKKMNYFAIGHAEKKREEFAKYAEQFNTENTVQESDEKIKETLQNWLDRLLAIHPYGKVIQSTGTSNHTLVDLGVQVAKANAKLNWEKEWYTKAGIGNTAYRRLIDDPTIDLNVIDPPGYSSTLIGYTNPDERSYTGRWTISRDPVSEYKSAADDMLAVFPAGTLWSSDNPTEMTSMNMLMALVGLADMGVDKDLLMKVNGMEAFKLNWAEESDVPVPIVDHILGNKDLNLIGFKFIRWLDFTIGDTEFSGVSQTPNDTWVAKPEYEVIIPPPPPDIEYNINNTPEAYNNV